MRADDFVALRRDDWNRLEDLLAQASDGRMKAFRRARVLTAAGLYRGARADFARAQRVWPGQPVHRYRNGFVARGHGVIYRRTGSFGHRLRRFYLETLP